MAPFLLYDLGQLAVFFTENGCSEKWESARDTRAIKVNFLRLVRAEVCHKIVTRTILALSHDGKHEGVAIDTRHIG